MKRVVCDTGPLLHLREAGCLAILQATGRILIPRAVQTELMSLDPSWQRERPEWVEVWELEARPSEEAMDWLRSGVLDLGEAEALALAAQMAADWFLTDDAAARMVAQQQGLEVHGSLGVVLWAAVKGHFSRAEAEAALEALSRSSLWISSRVLAEVHLALQQIFDVPE